MNKLFQLQKLKQLTGFEFFVEYKFHDKRRWRFDFCHLESKTAIEIEGGAFTNGRHTRGTGFINDMEKYNQAAVLGWQVLRFTPSQMNETKSYELIKKVIENKLNQTT